MLGTRGPVSAEPASAETPILETPVLELRDISKSFGQVQALTDVDLEVRRGEVMALVGDNGAGKSTLIKAIAGTQPGDSGDFLFEGQEVTVHAPTDATRLGIATVYQDLAGISGVNARDRLDQRRLAGAVVADERRHLAAVHVEVDVRQCLDRAEGLGDVAELEEWSVVGQWWSGSCSKVGAP